MALTALAVAIFVVFIESAVSDEQTSTTNCPDLSPMKNFDANQYIGKWYVIRFSAHTIAMPDVKCQVRTLTQTGENTLDLYTEAIDSKTNKLVQSHGTLIEDSDVPSKSQLQDALEQHTVLQTDYQTYAIVSHCITVNGVPGYILMVTSRQNTLATNAADAVGLYLDINGLTDNWRNMLQSGCETS